MDECPRLPVTRAGRSSISRQDSARATWNGWTRLQAQRCVGHGGAANAVLKSFRVSLCSNAADALISHIPDDARPSHRLTDEMGLRQELRDQLIQLIEADVDPEGDELLRRRVGEQIAARQASRTRLFLTTALLQFDGMGKSPCIDYTPRSRFRW
jgi:hypothetical protein